MALLEAGCKAPDFSGTDQFGEEVSLSKLSGEKLILYFYPKDNTPGCTAEACDFRDNYQMWQKKGYKVIGVSPDTEASHKKFSEKHALPFPIIPDPDKQIITSYGAWGEKKMFGKVKMGVLRSTFIINEKGIIEAVFDKVKTKEHSNQIINHIEN